MTEYNEPRQVPCCDRTIGEMMGCPNAAATDRHADAIDRQAQVMARVARRLGDLERAIDR